MTSRIAFVAVAVGGLLMAPAAGRAQGVTLGGTVRAAQTAEPLSGVEVAVVEAGRSTTTAVDGAYRIDRLLAGTYTVRVTVPGRLAREERVELAAGRGRVLDVALAVAPVQLDAVNVLLERTTMLGGRLTPVAGSAHQVTTASIRHQGRLIDDVHAILRQVPGVNVQDEDGFGLRPNIGLRGTGVERSSKISVMEDGVPAAPAPYSAPAAYAFPVAGRMESVEVRKGSSQVRYGPWTTGGAINFVSSSIPATLRLDADMAGGGHGTRKVRAEAGDSYRHFGWLAQTYQVQSSGFKALDGGADTGFDVRDYLFRLRVNTDPGARRYQELEFKAVRTDERSDETYLGLTEDDFGRSPLRRYAGSQEDVMAVAQRKFMLRHLLRASSAVDVTTTAYHNVYDRSWYKLDAVGGRGIAAILADPSAHAAELAILRGADSGDGALRVRANDRAYRVRGIQSVLGVRFRALARHSVEFGIRLHADLEDRFQHDDVYRMAGGRMERTAAGAPGSQDNRIGAARALALHVEDRIDIGAWSIAPGVRYESIRFTRTDYARGDATRATPDRVLENGVDVVIPGIGVLRRVGRALALFGGVHRGFGPPGPGANDSTRAEESVNYEAGLRYHAGWANAQVVAFRNDYSNILGRATLAVGESGSGDLFNGGAARTHGVEVAADIDAGAAIGLPVRAPVRLAYTWTDARFESAFESAFDSWGSVRPGDRLPYLPVHQVNAGAGLEGRRWAGRVGVGYASAMRTRSGSGPIPVGEGTDAYFVVDVAADVEALPGARLYAGVQNIADARYIVARRPAGLRPGLPRTALVGLRLSH